MILESIVTSRNPDGTVNIAPMGPHCRDRELTQFELRPFQTSTTFRNLSERLCGVMHVTDDVLLMVRVALNQSPADAGLRPAEVVDCDYLTDACRAYEFEVSHVNASGPRASLQCRTRHTIRLRDFFGFNRAKHMLIEVTILATRMDFVPREEILARLAEYAPIIEKTGGEQELRALALLQQVVTGSTAGGTGLAESAR
jgi:hypothetical protein